MTTIAFDYQKQAWITEPEAAGKLRREQLTTELAILTGPRGAEYARFVSHNEPGISQASLIADIRAELERLAP
jgi:hypothetical protein